MIKTAAAVVALDKRAEGLINDAVAAIGEPNRAAEVNKYLMPNTQAGVFGAHGALAGSTLGLGGGALAGLLYNLLKKKRNNDSGLLSDVAHGGIGGAVLGGLGGHAVGTLGGHQVGRDMVKLIETGK
jgi:hypothetical protein